MRGSMHVHSCFVFPSTHSVVTLCCAQPLASGRLATIGDHRANTSNKLAFAGVTMCSFSLICEVNYMFLNNIFD